MESTTSAQCHFVYFTGPRAGQAEPFNSARVTAGKASNCDFRIDPNFEDVAGQHAEVILEENDRWMLYDLSKGSTYINGHKIKERQTLLPEDYIRFGANGPEVIFRIGPPVPGFQPIPTLTAEDAQLQFFSGTDAKKAYTVSGSGVTRIGRRTELEIPLDPRGDMIVSGNHCSIVFEDGAFILTDTSRNGTYVNGELVEGSTEISDGDVIMLGDGGPQARFRAKSAGIIYPNLRAYYQGSQAESPQPTGEASSPVVGQQPDMFKGETPLAPPAPVRLPFADEHRSRRPLWIGTVLLLSIAGIMWWLSSHRQATVAPRAVAAAHDYLEDIKGAKPQENRVGGYTVNLPEGWTLRQQDALYSMESADKEIAVDYARSLELDEQSVVRLLGQDSAKVAKLPAIGRQGNRDMIAYVAKGSGVARMAVLHRPKGEVPALAMLETEDSRLPKLSAELIQSLLVSNVQTAKLSLPPTPTPVPTPNPTPRPRPVATARAHATATVAPAKSPSPTPRQVAQVTPAPTLAPTPLLTPGSEPQRATTPAPTTAPNITPAVPQSPAIADQAPAQAAPQAGSVANKNLGVSLSLPANWIATNDEAEGIITLNDPDDLNIRIARDRKVVNMDNVLASLAKEGWKRAGVRKLTNFSMAELKKEGEDLILVLIPEQTTRSTLIVYASRNTDISAEQRNGIVQIVQQLRSGETPDS